VEPGVPPLDKRIETFRQISDRFYNTGKKRVIWRYDPVILSKEFDFNFHAERFRYLAEKLKGYTDRCIISVVDLYKKTERGLNGMEQVDADPHSQKVRTLLEGIVKSAQNAGMEVFSCAEEDIYKEIGIKKGSCIDGELIEELFGLKLHDKINTKDKGQREACGCIVSRDIGMNHSCMHGCLYCYATSSFDAARKNYKKHDPNSPMLTGEPTGGETIYEVKRKSERKEDKRTEEYEQGDLFDLPV
jgi:hypothetical protein